MYAPMNIVRVFIVSQVQKSKKCGLISLPGWFLLNNVDSRKHVCRYYGYVVCEYK